jgi:hypothetical protein
VTINMMNIRKIITLIETAGSDGSREALTLVDKAAKKFGRARLTAGNCGTFALALATCLREQGFIPNIAFIYRWMEDVDSIDIDVLAEHEPDIYHVVVMLGDRMFDFSGETNVDGLMAFSVREYRDREPGFLRDIGMDEPAIHSLIEHDTNWSITTAAFLQAMR